MELMANEVTKCLRTASFGGKSLLCYRGIKRKDFLFDDEDRLNSFLSFSEHGKQEFCGSYAIKSGELLTQVHVAWDVNTEFQG